MKQCLNCKSLIDDGAKFCPECGIKVENVRRCVKCGKEIDEDSIFCPYCGIQQKNNDDTSLKEFTSIESPIDVEGNENIDIISAPASQKESHGDSKQGSSLMKIILGSIVIIILGGVLWYMASPSIDKQEGIEFLEYFYNNGGLSEDEDFIRQHITKNAYNWLRENFYYDCYDDDCLGIWYFTRQPGADFGRCLGTPTFKHLRGNSFQVSIPYESGVYNVILVLKKENDTIKIDLLKDYNYVSNSQ